MFLVLLGVVIEHVLYIRLVHHVHCCTTLHQLSFLSTTQVVVVVVVVVAVVVGGVIVDDVIVVAGVVSVLVLMLKRYEK